MSTKLLGFSSDKSRYVTGDIATIYARFSGAVSVDTFGNTRVPVLALSNGAEAIFSGRSSTDPSLLVFRYVVGTSGRSSDLAVRGFHENDAIIKDATGARATVTVVKTGSASDTVLTPANDDIVFYGAASTASDDDDTVQVVTSTSSTSVDLIAPKIRSMSAVSSTYRVGDTLEVRVTFDEAVFVNVQNGNPTLKLVGGGSTLLMSPAYVSGTGTNTLVFKLPVGQGFPTISGVNVSGVSLNGGEITDLQGNVANLAVVPGQNNLPPSVMIGFGGGSGGGSGGDIGTDTGGQYDSADVTPARIDRITSLDGNGPFTVGNTVRFAVKLSESVSLDTSSGVPMLVLSNGGRATYVSGTGSDTLVFNYVVKATDRNSLDLSVLGFAENDARILDAGGNATDVRISSSNNLSSIADVKINAQAPYIRSIEAADDMYIPGDTIVFTAQFSEAVMVQGGAPSLVLSNGARAIYQSGDGTRELVFAYNVPSTAQSGVDIDVTGLQLAAGVSVRSVLSGNPASLSVRSGILSGTNDVSIDADLPQGTISIDRTQFKAGDTATVTVTFNEPVLNPFDAITVENGTLSPLVNVVAAGGDNTAQFGRVWTGTFQPSIDIEIPQAVLRLNNALVQDAAGNHGVGQVSSNAVLIDTQGPEAEITVQPRADGSRLFRFDFGEPVSNANVAKFTVENGNAGTLVQVSESVYTLVVTPKTATPSGAISIVLQAGAVSDALGNPSNMTAPLTASWDITGPVITGMTVVPDPAHPSSSYRIGDVIEIDVAFSEAVLVNRALDNAAQPQLVLDNGRMANYVSGEGTSVLRFAYTVEAGDEASALDVIAVIENGAVLEDAAGNAALVQIIAGVNNLASHADVSIDGVVPAITAIRADGDGLFTAGKEIALTVQFSENIEIDTIGGEPILTLSNGAVATYVDAPDRLPGVLHFVYQVQQGDNDILGLDVLGLAENGAVIQDSSRNVANVAIREGFNNLALRHEVNIDADWPRIAGISANSGYYSVGDEIDIAVAMTKSIRLDLTQGEPDLVLSNGSIATYLPSKSSSGQLMFRYKVTDNDTQTDDLSVVAFRTGNARITSLIAGTEAQIDGLGRLEVPDLPIAQNGVVIDMDLPQVQSIVLADSALAAGETTTVTVTLTEAVKGLNADYFTVPHGRLSSFITQDGGTTWVARYTPVRAVSAEDLVITLDASRLNDRAGNAGVGVAASGQFDLDSVYPTATLRSDMSGVATGPVRVIVTFSEPVTGFSAADLVIENGSPAYGFSGPNTSNEYSFFVDPLPNSTQPVKVRIPEGVASDIAGNTNRASAVLVQPVDTDPAEIVSIHSTAGAYNMGDKVTLKVAFSEKVSIDLDPDYSEQNVPALYLNNGQTAHYVSGSGTGVWTFEYVVAPKLNADGSLALDQNGDPEVIDRSPLQVLSFLPNDTMPVDGAGNPLTLKLTSSNRLSETVVIDTLAPVIVGFEAINGTYALGDVVYITAQMSEAVSVVTANGSPALHLSNGAVATYLSGGGD